MDHPVEEANSTPQNELCSVIESFTLSKWPKINLGAYTSTAVPEAEESVALGTFCNEGGPDSFQIYGVATSAVVKKEFELEKERPE